MGIALSNEEKERTVGNDDSHFFISEIFETSASSLAIFIRLCYILFAIQFHLSKKVVR